MQALVCECMHEYVSQIYPAPRAPSSDAPLSAPLLHAEPSEPSAVYTLQVLLLALSLFISFTHSRSAILPPSLLRSPSSSLQYISHFCALLLSCVLSLFSPSLFITVFRPPQIKTLGLYKHCASLGGERESVHDTSITIIGESGNILFLLTLKKEVYGK